MKYWNLNKSRHNEGDSSEGEGKREDRLPSPEVDQQHLVMWRRYFCADDGDVEDAGDDAASEGFHIGHLDIWIFVTMTLITA